MGPTLHIQLLGNFYIKLGDTPVTRLNSARLQSLLAYLLLHRDAPQPRSQLAYLFWPDSSDKQSRTNLRNLYLLLRKALPDSENYLRAADQTVQWWANAPYELDVAGFEASMVRASQALQSGDRAGLRSALETAVALYQGDLLPDCYADWILAPREQLRQYFMGALEQLIILAEEEQDYNLAVDYAQSLLRYDPLHEAAYRRLMRLYDLNGDRASALRLYHTCAVLLKRELSIDPSPATLEIYENLLRQTNQPGVQHDISFHQMAVSPLVGREQEWDLLQALWQAIAAGKPHMAVLTGEAGTGKTRLLEELQHWAGECGIRVVFTGCHPAEGRLAFAPVVAWLRSQRLPDLNPIWLGEISRLLPEILVKQPEIRQPAPMRKGWHRQRLFEALAKAFLCGSGPLLLLVDNLQWCDRETLHWLHYLLRYDPQTVLLIVGTLRSEEVLDNPPLAKLLCVLQQQARLTEIELDRLDECQTLAMAEYLAEGRLTPNLAVRLYQETEGNPFFISEMVRAAIHQNGLEGKASLSLPVLEQEILPLPIKIQAVLQDRLALLSRSARDLAQIAAVMGWQISYQDLRQASEMGENELVETLDELCQRRILIEDGPSTYAFSHSQLQRYIFNNLSAARRRMLQCRVGSLDVQIAP